MDFDPARYSLIAPLVVRDQLMDLGPGLPNHGLEQQLRGLSASTIVPLGTPKDRRMAEACLAGLWLRHDFLDESHAISQSMGSTTGSYWHAIMHRREPDAWNSKYWWDRVGRHPVFTELLGGAAQIARQMGTTPGAVFLLDQAQWDPHRFVDLCEAARLGREDSVELCRKIQQREWELLFDHCYRTAVGSSIQSFRHPTDR